MIDSSSFKRAHPQTCSAELSDAQDHLKALFEKQRQHVVSVRLLPNFSIDHDRSKAENTAIYRGLVVNVKDTYELSPEDKCWFHPEMGKGRSVFQNVEPVKHIQEQVLGQTEEVKASISPFNSSVGEYYSQTEDTYGIVTKNKYCIASTGSENRAYPLWSSWCDSYTSMKKVYAQWKSMNIADAVRDDRRSLTASSSKMTYNDTINNIYSDGKSLYVTNHALKCNSGDKVLCEVSPTSGYVWMSVAGKNRCNDFVPSDCGFADHFVNVHTLRQEHKARFYNDCSWLSDKPFNTYVMRKPLISMDTLSDAANMNKKERLFMKKMTCSSQPFETDYERNTLLQLTPLEQKIHVPFKQTNEIVKYLLDNYHEISEQYPAFDLINPKYLKNKHLELPREIVELCH